MVMTIFGGAELKFDGVMGIFDWVLHMKNDDDEMLYFMLCYTMCEVMRFTRD
jgi:hypothetical protein